MASINSDSDDGNDPNILNSLANCNYYSREEMVELLHHKIKGNEYLSFLHFNIRGLANKLDDLKGLLCDLWDKKIRVHCILLCETLLNENTKLACQLPEYTMFTRNRQNGKRGGIAIYVHKILDATVREDLFINIDREFESLFVGIKCKLARNTCTEVLIGEIYRPPHTSKKQAVEKYGHIFTEASKHYSNIVIGTDQNIDYMNVMNDSNAADLLNECLSAGYKPLFNKPTRITRNTCTALDNIYARGLNSNFTSCILETDLSDHFPLFSIAQCCRIAKPKQQSFSFRPFTPDVIMNIQHDLILHNWNPLYNLEMDSAYSFFMEAYTAIIDRHAPLRTIKRSVKTLRREPWFTKGLANSHRRKQELYKLTLKNPQSEVHHDRYIDYRNKYNAVKKKAKQNHYNTLFNQCKNDMKKTWGEINSLLGRKSTKNDIIKYLSVDHKTIDTQEEIAQTFANHFYNVGPDQARSINTPPRTSFPSSALYTYESLFLNPINEMEVLKIISNMKSKKSQGYDHISTKHIKEIKHGLLIPLTILLNKCMESAIFPEALKTARILPIHKGKEKDQLNNYRPIALLSAISKIFEKAISNRIHSFLDTNDILIDNQYGFRPKRSTIQAVLELHNNIVTGIADKNPTLAIFVDLTKAFDIIYHPTLLKKLEMYGIRGTPNELIASYLDNRKMFVNCNNCNSPTLSLQEYGVPQGSILGPLLFLIYVNDMPSSIKHCKSILFADDTTLHITENKLEDALDNINEDLSNLTHWCNVNSLKINASKTNFMIFNNKSKSVLNKCKAKLQLTGQCISHVDTTKFLGIYIDTNLQWKTHTQHVKQKISSGLYALNRLKHMLPSRTLKSIYFSLIHSYLNYGCILWGNTFSKFLKPIQVQQNKAIRAIDNLKYNVSAADSFKKLSILNLTKIHALQTNTYMHQLNLNHLPRNLKKTFEPYVAPSHHYNTRSRNSNLYINPIINSDLAQRSIIVNGPKWYRSLPSDLKSHINIPQFKSNLKSYLLSSDR